MNEWTKYAIQLSEQLGIKGKPKGYVGENLQPEDLNLFKEDQIVQLYELMKAATVPKDDDNIINENVEVNNKNESNK